MSKGAQHLMVVALLTVGISVPWSSPSHACADPSPTFKHDPVVWELVNAPSEETETFLNRRYGTQAWEFNTNVVRVVAPERHGETRELKIRLNRNQCLHDICDKLEVFAIVEFLYNKEGRRQHSGPKILPMFAVERWSGNPDWLQIPLRVTPQVNGIFVSVRQTQGSTAKWNVHYLTEGFGNQWSCGWTEYAESQAWASLYDFCYSYSRGGFYYDIWPRSDIKSAICKNTGIVRNYR